MMKQYVWGRPYYTCYAGRLWLSLANTRGCLLTEGAIQWFLVQGDSSSNASITNTEDTGIHTVTRTCLPPAVVSCIIRRRRKHTTYPRFVLFSVGVYAWTALKFIRLHIDCLMTNYRNILILRVFFLRVLANIWGIDISVFFLTLPEKQNNVVSFFWIPLFFLLSGRVYDRSTLKLMLHIIARWQAWIQ